MPRIKKNHPIEFDIKRFVMGDLVDVRAHEGSEYRIYRFKANTKFSITEGDMETMVNHFPKQNLVRIQVNENGFIDLYFTAK